MAAVGAFATSPVPPAVAVCRERAHRHSGGACQTQCGGPPATSDADRLKVVPPATVANGNLNLLTAPRGRAGRSSGAWPEHMHFFMDAGGRDTPLGVVSLHTEYFVARDDLAAALRAVADASQHWPAWTTWDGYDPTTQGVSHICEVRTIAQDALWLSPCYGRESVSIHFTLGMFPAECHRLVGELEAALAPFDARPHWGKLWLECPVDQYEMAPQFKELRAAMDPTGKFCGAFVQRAIGL